MNYNKVEELSGRGLFAFIAAIAPLAISVIVEKIVQRERGINIRE